MSSNHLRGHYLNGHILCRGYDGLNWDRQLSLREKEISTKQRVNCSEPPRTKKRHPRIRKQLTNKLPINTVLSPRQTPLLNRAERSRETYNLFWAHTRLHSTAVMGKRSPACFSPFGYHSIYFVILTRLVTQTCMRLA